jgi:hypothetical protein
MQEEKSREKREQTTNFSKKTLMSDVGAYSIHILSYKIIKRKNANNKK